MTRFLSKDFLSGLLFIGFGLVTLYFGRHLAMGTAVRMGPGFVPHMLAYIMMGLGLIISVVALVTANAEQVDVPKWKPITLVTIGIFVFAMLFEPGTLQGIAPAGVLRTLAGFVPTGMFPALVALLLIASAGGDEFKLTEVIGNIVVLTILCILVFKIGLSMNISIINGVW